MIAPASPPPEARSEAGSAAGSAAGPSAIAYGPPPDFKECKYCPVPVYIHSKSMYRHVISYHPKEYVPTRNKGTSSRALARRKSQGKAKAADDSSESESEDESSKKTSDSAKKKSDSAKKKKYTPRKTSRNVKSGDESGSSKKAKKAKSADDDDEGPSSRKKAKSGDDEGPSSIKKAKSSKKEESGDDQQQDKSTDSDPLMSQKIADRNARLVGLRRSGRITVKYCHFILIVTMLPVSELVTYLLTYLLTYCSQQLAYF